MNNDVEYKMKNHFGDLWDKEIITKLDDEIKKVRDALKSKAFYIVQNPFDYLTQEEFNQHVQDGRIVLHIMNKDEYEQRKLLQNYDNAMEIVETKGKE